MTTSAYKLTLAVERLDQLPMPDWARTLRLFPISHPMWVDTVWLSSHVSESDDDCLPLLCPQSGPEKPCKRRYICFMHTTCWVILCQPFCQELLLFKRLLLVNTDEKKSVLNLKPQILTYLTMGDGS